MHWKPEWVWADLHGYVIDSIYLDSRGSLKQLVWKTKYLLSIKTLHKYSVYMSMHVY